MTLKKLGTSLRSSMSLILHLVSIPFGLSSTLIGGCTCIMMQCGLAVFGVIVVGFGGFICCIWGTLLFWRHVRLLFLATGVGRILVPCANHLYGPVLTLWMYLACYKSRILQSGCFFDQISRSTPKPAVDVS